MFESSFDPDSRWSSVSGAVLRIVIQFSVEGQRDCELEVI